VFEWDEGKSQGNLETRGFDFEYAVRIFKEAGYAGTATQHGRNRRRWTFVGDSSEVGQAF
jgi:uncharacterized DUF497 family protein